MYENKKRKLGPPGRFSTRRRVFAKGSAYADFRYIGQFPRRNEYKNKSTKYSMGIIEAKD